MKTKKESEKEKRGEKEREEEGEGEEKEMKPKKGVPVGKGGLLSLRADFPNNFCSKSASASIFEWESVEGERSKPKLKGDEGGVEVDEGFTEKVEKSRRAGDVEADGA